MSNELRLLCNRVPIHLRLAQWSRSQKWEDLPIRIEGDAILCNDVVNLKIVLRQKPLGLGFELDMQAVTRTRIGIFVCPGGMESRASVFHVLPGFLFGDNNLDYCLQDGFPHLTDRESRIGRSPYWECRADRCAMPISALACDTCCVAIAIAPYAKGVSAEETTHGDVANGLISCLSQNDSAACCGASLGYANLPWTYVRSNNFELPRQQRLFTASTSGQIYALTGGDRRQIHRFIRAEYGKRRESPGCGKGLEQTVRACSLAMRDLIWSETQGVFCNLYFDPKQAQTPIRRRPLKEIGWCGGPPVALPALQAGLHFQDALLIDRAMQTCNRIPGLINPRSGLLWDNGMCGDAEANGWWSAREKDRHWSYTGGGCLSDLLGAGICLEQAGRPIPAAWLEVAVKVLDTIVGIQLDDGNLGYAYSLDCPAIMDVHGMNGCWYVPALALLGHRLGRQDFLDAAIRAMDYYHGFVRALNCWGGPMDTGKANDEEGILGFIRAAATLCRITGDNRFLEMWQDGADYEFLFRYGYKSHPLAPPLSVHNWNSCGGSLTSVANPHIHPMGIRISGELRQLAELTRDIYFRERWEDGIRWSLASLALYPDAAGIGPFGITTERYCPSDGLLVERHTTDGVSSIWYACHCFGVAGMLEGMMDALASGWQPDCG